MVETYFVITDNIALNKAVSQISTYLENQEYAGEAEYAVNGDNNPGYFDGSCSLTSSGDNLWWQVDLGGLYAVSTVYITSRSQFGKFYTFSKIIIPEV